MFGAGSGLRVVHPWYISYWPNLKHTYTQYTHTHACMHAHTYTHTHTDVHTHTQTHTHAAHTDTHSQTRKHARACLANTHTRARAHTHTLPHTYSQVPTTRLC